MKKLVKSLSYLLTISLIVFLLPTNTNAATPTYMYEWMNQSGTISSDGLAHEYTNLQAGQTLQLSLTLMNQAGNTIRARHRLGNSPGKQVPIGSYGIGSQTPYQDGTPSFLDPSSFVLNNNRFAYYDGDDVPHGGVMTISWNIKLKENLANGAYNLYVRPVSEYNAWTRQSKNGKLLPDTNSDIFWRLVVGRINNSEDQITENRRIKIADMTTSNMLSYQSSKYGFSFDYREPLEPAGLDDTGDISDEGWNIIRGFNYGIPTKGMTWVMVNVYRSKNLNEVIDFNIDNQFKYSAYTREETQRNGLDFIVFKYTALGNAHLPAETRFAKLPSGWIVGVTVLDWWADSTSKDQVIVDSLRAI